MIRLRISFHRFDYEGGRVFRRQSRGNFRQALKLVEQVITDAQAAGIKIVPLCSYVDAQFRRHPEWADLLA